MSDSSIQESVTSTDRVESVTKKATRLPDAPLFGNRIRVASGAIWDVRECAYVLKCPICRRLCFTARPQTKTCSAACRKLASRAAAGSV